MVPPTGDKANKCRRNGAPAVRSAQKAIAVPGARQNKKDKKDSLRPRSSSASSRPCTSKAEPCARDSEKAIAGPGARQNKKDSCRPRSSSASSRPCTSKAEPCARDSEKVATADWVAFPQAVKGDKEDGKDNKDGCKDYEDDKESTAASLTSSRDNMLSPPIEVATPSSHQNSEVLAAPSAAAESLSASASITNNQIPVQEEFSPEPRGTDDQLSCGLAAALGRISARATEKRPMTIFHAVRAPPMGIRDYMARIKKFFCCSGGCFVLGMVYIDRVMKRYPEIEISPLSCHRLLITSMLVAAKFHDDVFYSNAYYAKVGGVQQQEMNVLEARFLGLLGWKLKVTPEEYRIYEDALCREAAAVAAARPEQQRE